MHIRHDLFLKMGYTIEMGLMLYVIKTQTEIYLDKIEMGLIVYAIKGLALIVVLIVCAIKGLIF